MTQSDPWLSVIIPTYNRLESIQACLERLERQSLPAHCFEVIVVDDGSSYDPAPIISRQHPFELKYLRQANQGATIARNHAASQARGTLLVFIDDDVRIAAGALAALHAAWQRYPGTILLGALQAFSPEPRSPYTRIAIEEENANYRRGQAGPGDQFVHFSHCNTQLLAVPRQLFTTLDRLQDPTGGWPNWDDVDFGYRAHLAGYRLLRVDGAIGEHWDHSLQDRKTACNRWYRASRSAARLFQRYPGLQAEIPMYADKTPITWGRDSLPMVLRKLLRRAASARLSLGLLESLAGYLERRPSASAWLARLYRWIAGAYMYRGYQDGLQALKTG